MGRHWGTERARPQDRSQNQREMATRTKRFAEDGPVCTRDPKRQATESADVVIPPTQVIQARIDEAVRTLAQFNKPDIHTSLHHANRALENAGEDDELVQAWSALVEGYEAILEKEALICVKVRRALNELCALRNCRITLNRIRRHPNPGPLDISGPPGPSAVELEASPSGSTPSSAATSSGDVSSYARSPMSHCESVSRFETQPLDPTESQTQTQMLF